MKVGFIHGVIVFVIVVFILVSSLILFFACAIENVESVVRPSLAIAICIYVVERLMEIFKTRSTYSPASQSTSLLLLRFGVKG